MCLMPYVNKGVSARLKLSLYFHLFESDSDIEAEQETEHIAQHTIMCSNVLM